MNEAQFEGLTLKTVELRHLLDKAEMTWRCALAERQDDLVDETYADIPEIAQVT